MLAAAGCESPIDPSDDDDNNNGTATCRTAAANSQTVQVFQDGQVVSTTRTCSFNAAENEVNCQLTFTDSTFGPGTGTQTSRWTSRNDVIDEVAVNPPRPRSLGTTTVLTSGGLTLTTTATNTYDSQRRLASMSVVNFTSTVNTTYSAWDSSGRPTSGTTVLTSPGGTLTFSETTTYDNNTRMLVRSSGPNTCTITHDQNGNIILETCTGTTPSTATTTIQTTQQVCR